MRLFPSILLVSLLLALCGCDNRNTVPPEPEPGPGPGPVGPPVSTALTFRATLQPFTGADGIPAPALQWKAGDRIAVFCGKENSSNQYSYSTKEGDGVFTGSGTKASRYWSVWPPSMVEQFSPGKSGNGPDTLASGQYAHERLSRRLVLL